MARDFYRVKCSECGNEQKIFSHASTKVECLVCSEELATPTGGKADVNGEIAEELKAE
ncbi:MAG: 30S ribosomal protein S27e [Nanohaloarchaea archaeon SW_7_43_1]|nr:MAG: 30S ribosomal protein S27e [Nanohaloarchaea archaeon SW_7_43_1]PSH01211.1 MAG: 30S ribosomal protein S27e [Nanohaloarchaea archaeon SW_10_44_10]PSH01728.1 MAG: 30S ribosomal protein S27e [Nanohaloarchaea archaeon SW_10_44_10]